jgi:hypothetical protein
MEHRGGDVILAGEPLALPQRDPRGPQPVLRDSRGPPPPSITQTGGPQALPQRQFQSFNNKRQVISIF